MDKESRHGQMVLNMKENGRIIKLMDKGSFGIRMVTIIMGDGWMIRLMDLECMCIRMELNMKENGVMICSMEEGLRIGRMVVSMWGYTRRARRMEKEITRGLMAVSI